MPYFFASADGISPAGRTIACVDSSALGSVSPVSLDPLFSFDTLWAIVTNVQGSDEVSLQAQVMAGGDIGIHVTGDKPTPLAITGYAVPRNCANIGDTRHGLGRVFEWYQRNKASARKSPIFVTVARRQILAFLIRLDWGLTDPTTQMAQFTFQCLALPSVEEPAKEAEEEEGGEEEGDLEPPEDGAEVSSFELYRPGEAPPPSSSPPMAGVSPLGPQYVDNLVGGYARAGSSANYAARPVAGNRPYLAGPPGF